jgi:hypothetical protein
MSARSAASRHTRRGWCTSRWTRTAWSPIFCARRWPRCGRARSSSTRCRPSTTRRASHSPSTGAPRCSRSVGVRRRRRRSPGLQQAHLPGAPLARPRGRLPGLVLQDVRVRPAGGMGTRTTRRARPAGAGRRIGDAQSAEFHPDVGLSVAGRTRLAQPGQDVHRGLPRPPRRHARRLGDLPPDGCTWNVPDGAGGGARRPAHVRQPGAGRIEWGPQAPSPHTPRRGSAPSPCWRAGSRTSAKCRYGRDDGSRRPARRRRRHT